MSTTTILAIEAHLASRGAAGTTIIRHDGYWQASARIGRIQIHAVRGANIQQALENLISEIEAIGPYTPPSNI